MALAERREIRLNRRVHRLSLRHDVSFYSSLVALLVVHPRSQLMVLPLLGDRASCELLQVDLLRFPVLHDPSSSWTFRPCCPCYWHLRRDRAENFVDFVVVA